MFRTCDRATGPYPEAGQARLHLAWAAGEESSKVRVADDFLTMTNLCLPSIFVNGGRNQIEALVYLPLFIREETQPGRLGGRTLHFHCYH